MQREFAAQQRFAGGRQFPNIAAAQANQPAQPQAADMPSIAGRQFKMMKRPEGNGLKDCKMAGLISTHAISHSNDLEPSHAKPAPTLQRICNGLSRSNTLKGSAADQRFGS